MFLVASRIAWRRTSVQCNRFTHTTNRGSYGRLLSCGENLYTRTRKRDPQKLIQVRWFKDEKFRVEIKVNSLATHATKV